MGFVMVLNRSCIHMSIEGVLKNVFLAVWNDKINKYVKIKKTTHNKVLKEL
jgi:hypothetical protein